MQRLFFGWVVSLGIVMGCMVRAEEPVTSIRLITTEWPGYTNQDGTGLYFDVIKAVYEPEGVKVEFELVPWKRAQMLVKTQADALVGEYWLPEEDYLYPQWPLDVEELTVLFKKGSVPAWNGESTLENTNVAWIRGYDFQAYFIVAMAIHEIDELRSGLVMLEKDRIDFLVDYADSIEEEAEHLRKTLNPEFDLAQYQMEPLRIGAKIHVAFVNSARGKTLVEIFERRMAQLFESGVLDAMYRDFEEWDYDGYPK